MCPISVTFPNHTFQPFHHTLFSARAPSRHTSLFGCAQPCAPELIQRRFSSKRCTARVTMTCIGRQVPPCRVELGETRRDSAVSHYTYWCESRLQKTRIQSVIYFCLGSGRRISKRLREPYLDGQRSPLSDAVVGLYSGNNSIFSSINHSVSPLRSLRAPCCPGGLSFNLYFHFPSLRLLRQHIQYRILTAEGSANRPAWLCTASPSLKSAAGSLVCKHSSLSKLD